DDAAADHPRGDSDHLARGDGTGEDAEETRLPVRRADDRTRVDGGHRHGRRPPRRIVAPRLLRPLGRITRPRTRRTRSDRRRENARREPRRTSSSTSLTWDYTFDS